MKHKRSRGPGYRKQLMIAGIAGLFITAGIVWYGFSGAASYATAIEAESGTAAGTAELLTGLSSASGASAVRFGGSQDVPVGATTLFSDTFDNLDKYPSRHNAGKPWSVTIADQGPGHEKAVRFELRDGDEWDGGTERTELLPGNGQDVREGDERWYEFDIKIGDPDWPKCTSPSNKGCVVFQWHSDDETVSPPLAFRIYQTNQFRFTSDIDNQPPIDFYNIRPGVWERVVLHVKFSNNKSVGFIEAYINGVEVLKKQQRRTMLDSRNYLKFGIYRDPDNTATHVLSYDNLRISK